MLKYRYNPHAIEIAELTNATGVEFRIKLLEDDPYVEGLKRVRDFFEEDKVYTDVLFYAFPDHEYTIHVREDYYTAFVTELFKNRLLLSVEWAT